MPCLMQSSVTSSSSTHEQSGKGYGSKFSVLNAVQTTAKFIEALVGKSGHIVIKTSFSVIEANVKYLSSTI